MYADDVQIYNSGPLNRIKAYVNNINSDLQKIGIWAKNIGLCINPTKSKCILIDRRNRKITNDIQIKINSNVIEFVSCSENLGVIFNNKLTWSNQNLWYVEKSLGCKMFNTF